MNSKMLLDALGDISDEYVMSAQKYLTNEVLKITNSKAYQRTAPQKLLILAATIAAVMSLLLWLSMKILGKRSLNSFIFQPLKMSRTEVTLLRADWTQ